MRQINILIPDKEVHKVLEIAKKSDLNAAHVRAAGPFDLVIITVPDDSVNKFITKLKDADIDKLGTISILPIFHNIYDSDSVFIVFFNTFNCIHRGISGGCCR